jgi:imidazolonepropionase-like amidohydrolase
MLKSILSFCLLLTSLVIVSAQTDTSPNRKDRRAFINEGTATSPDPRRVPIAPIAYGPADSFALVGGRVFSGTGEAAKPADVLVYRNKIVAVAKPGSLVIPAKVNVLNIKGKTLMPGLIDLHTHLTYTEEDTSPANAVNEADATLRAVERLRFYIESGITSVRDVGSINKITFRLKDWVAQRRLMGPRVFPAGKLITGKGGHGAESLEDTSPLYGSVVEASGPDEWRNAVRQSFKDGADLIKVASHFSKDEIKAAVDEAHALGLKITCDCETFYIEWAVDAGIDMIEHPLPRTDETIKKMADKGVASIPTLIPYTYIFDLWGGYWGSTSRRFSFSKEDNLIMLKRLRAANVKLGIGTDLILSWFRYLPYSYITELKSFVKAGFSSEEALVAATKTSAEILDMDHLLGTIEVGKLADILIIDGQPDVNLDDLAKVYMVIRDGEIVVQGGKTQVPGHIPIPEPKSGNK